MKKQLFILIPVLCILAAIVGIFLFQPAAEAAIQPLYKNPPEYGELMSSRFDVTVAGWIAPDWADLHRHAEATSRAYDHRDPSGALHALNRTGRISDAPLLTRILRDAIDISKKSSGAFDATVMPLIELWDMEHGGRLPSPGDIAAALKNVGYEKIDIAPNGAITLAAGARVDLGGIAQGAVVDEVSAYLDGKGYTRYLVNASGDILVRDTKPDGSPWRIAIKSPRIPGVDIASPEFASGSLPMLGIVEVGAAGRKMAIVTSGDYEQFFVKDSVPYHHIIDPSTGYPSRGAASATVLAPRCETADALATAVLVLGYEKGLELLEKLPDIEGLMVRDSGAGRLEWKATSGFPRLIPISR